MKSLHHTHLFVRNVRASILRLAGLALLPVVIAGCFSARIGTGTTPANRRDTTVSVATDLWGSVMSNRIIRDDSVNTFSDIEITQDFGQVLISLLTLGVYVPLTAHCYMENCSTEIER